MSYEVLLEWASERGSGSWGAFRDAHDWVFNAGRNDEKRVKATTTMHAFGMLGHVESDWGEGIWAVAPPALTILPCGGAHAVLAGARSRAMIDRLEVEAEELDLFIERHKQDWGPDTLFVAASSEAGIEMLASRLGIAYELCVSERLAALLPCLDSYLALAESTPAARGFGIRRFDEQYLMFGRTDSDRAPGLYQYEGRYRPEYRWLSEGGVYYAVDRAIGAYAELRRVGRTELRYERDTVNGTLSVPFRVQLPALHARAATLCSGLMPRLESWRWLYLNVPAETALKIALSLGQELAVRDSERNA